jgi:hypothetical protein
MSRPLMVAGRLQVLERRVAEGNHGRWCDERAGVCVDIDMDLGSVVLVMLSIPTILESWAGGA